MVAGVCHGHGGGDMRANHDNQGRGEAVAVDSSTKPPRRQAWQTVGGKLLHRSASERGQEDEQDLARQSAREGGTGHARASSGCGTASCLGRS